MKLYLHLLIILNFLFLNVIFSQEETSKYYITDIRGDISLEIENYLIETVLIKENMIKYTKVKKLKSPDLSEDELD